MAISRTRFNTMDEYIASFPKNVQDILRELKKTIKDAAPDAEETISYGIPTFKLHSNLVHFAAYKNHIGFYPTRSPLLIFKKELTSFKQGKGTIQFPIDEPLPVQLIKKIVKYRVKENLTKK